MNNVILDYNYLNSYFNNATIQEAPVILKGATTVNVSLTGVSEDKYVVDMLTIDWGDGSRDTYKRDLFFNYKTQSIFNEVLYGRTNGTVLGVFSHDYANKYSSYEVDYTISIVIQKNNGQYIYVKQPLRCFWGSFYDSMESLNAINSQILPQKTNDTFLNLESKEGLVAASLRETGVPLISAVLADIDPLDIFGFQQPGFLAATDQSDSFKIKDIEITMPTGETYVLEVVLGYEEFDPFVAGF